MPIKGPLSSPFLASLEYKRIKTVASKTHPPSSDHRRLPSSVTLRLPTLLPTPDIRRSPPLAASPPAGSAALAPPLPCWRSPRPSPPLVGFGAPCRWPLLAPPALDVVARRLPLGPPLPTGRSSRAPCRRPLLVPVGAAGGRRCRRRRCAQQRRATLAAAGLREAHAAASSTAQPVIFCFANNL